VLVGRCIPGIRSLISIPAGVERMPIPQFLLLTAAGSAVWNTVLILAGAALGDQWDRVSEYVDVFTYATVAIIVLAVGWFIVQRVRDRRASREAASTRTREP
jgi:membrane protein DedA with SNARE-associated domain